VPQCGKKDGKEFDFIGDTAITIPVGKISPMLKQLLKDTQKSLYAALSACNPGNTLDDIGGAIEDIALAGAYGIVRDYGGHGDWTKLSRGTIYL
jgi:Methionine aminopeptidase